VRWLRQLVSRLGISEGGTDMGKWKRFSVPQTIGVSPILIVNVPGWWKTGYYGFDTAHLTSSVPARCVDCPFVWLRMGWSIRLHMLDYFI
jgi:hypothetical protein